MNRMVLALSSCLLSVWVSWAETVCQDDYPKHLQGLATDADNNMYWSFTTFLVKTNADGALLAKVAVPSHYGDLAWWNDKIYVAVNLGKFNQEPGQADSWVYVHDAKSLALLSKHAIPEAVHGAGGIDCNPDGRFFVVGGLPSTHTENYVYEYGNTFNFIKRHVIASGQTKMGIQTACRRLDGSWWFGCYGSPAITLRTDESFKLLGKYNFNGAYGIARTADDKVMLIGKNSCVQSRHTGSAQRVPITVMTAVSGN